MYLSVDGCDIFLRSCSIYRRIFDMIISPTNQLVYSKLYFSAIFLVGGDFKATSRSRERNDHGVNLISASYWPICLTPYNGDTVIVKCLQEIYGNVHTRHTDGDKMAGILQTTYIKFVLLDGNCCILIKNFTEMCSQGSNKQYSGIGTYNVLAPTRWKAISWTNVCIDYWRIYMHYFAWMHCHIEAWLTFRRRHF